MDDFLELVHKYVPLVVWVLLFAVFHMPQTAKMSFTFTKQQPIYLDLVAFFPLILAPKSDRSGQCSRRAIS